MVVNELVGNPGVRVQSISFDSRVVSGPTLFVAIKGAKVDGHCYIRQAIAAGSLVVVCERIPDRLVEYTTYVVVTDSANALGKIAANFYDVPSDRLKLVAVTGTNGKTSTVHMLFELFRQLGYRVGMLSTIHNKIEAQTIPTTLTTLDAIQLNALLARMVVHGCQYCFMEASSHAIVQQRVAGLRFAGAVFLNITHDHLDYHQTFDAYIQAKKQLFDNLLSHAFALYNADDRRGTVMIQNTQATAHSFALKTSATFTARLLSNTLQGLALRIDGQSVWFRLTGAFNAYNLLATYATACLLLRMDSNRQILVALSSLTPIQGRFQHFRTRTGFDVIIDYAHTPDALRSVLATIGQLKSKRAKMITVVGCGGDRDKSKRPRMAQVACQLSDHVIFTTDNPRSEVPINIVRDMQVGITASQQQYTSVVLDRAEAIEVACRLAQPQDIVLIAGKGHETYQEIQGARLPFDDRKVLERIIH